MENKNVKHTPGPWRLAEQPTPHEFSKQIVGNDGRVHGQHVVNVFVQAGRESEANARLIAAAPEMLTMLKRLMEIGGHRFAEHIGDEVLALIARAEGRDE